MFSIGPGIYEVLDKCSDDDNDHDKVKKDAEVEDKYNVNDIENDTLAFFHTHLSKVSFINLYQVHCASWCANISLVCKCLFVWIPPQNQVDRPNLL